MLKSLMLLTIVVALITACTIYYQPHGKRGGGVVIKLPEKPEVKPMPVPDVNKNKKSVNETKSKLKQS